MSRSLYKEFGEKMQQERESVYIYVSEWKRERDPMSLNIVRPLPWETLSSCPIAPIMDTLRGWATLVGPQAPINQNSCLDANPNNISATPLPRPPQPPVCRPALALSRGRFLGLSYQHYTTYLQIVDSDNALNNSYVPPWHTREVWSFDISAPTPTLACSNINTEKETLLVWQKTLAGLLACYFTNHNVKSNARQRSVSSLLNSRPWGAWGWICVFSFKVWMSSHSALPARSIPPPATSIKAQGPWSNKAKASHAKRVAFSFSLPSFSFLSLFWCFGSLWV